MRLVTAVLLTIATRAAFAQEAPQPGTSSELAPWDLAVAAGASNASTAMPGMQMGSTSGTDDLEPTMLLSLRYRIGKRVVWSVPTLSFAYLGGERGGREWIPWGGLTGWGIGYSSVEKLIASGQVGAGLAVREWFGPSFALNATAQALSNFDYRGDRACGEAMCESWRGPTEWVASTSIGFSAHLTDALSLNAGAGVSQVINSDAERGVSVLIGSVQMVSLRQLPLVQAQLNKNWFLDGYALASYERTLDRIEQRYLVGFTRLWTQ